MNGGNGMRLCLGVSNVCGCELWVAGGDRRKGGCMGTAIVIGRKGCREPASGEGGGREGWRGR
jgi:hypothetical protein